MLNYLWGGMIILGIVIGAINGKLDSVTNAAISSSKDAINLCILLLGVMSMWMGFMNIAEKSGLVKSLTKKMSFITKFLFPELDRNSKAVEYISTNMIANLLGLGWAATPAGLKAMNELQKLNNDKKVASKSMCMFLIVNISSVQLIPMNIIAYRMQFGSSNPMEIVGPAIFATIISTLVGILSAKILGRCYR